MRSDIVRKDDAFRQTFAARGPGSLLSSASVVSAAAATPFPGAPPFGESGASARRLTSVRIVYTATGSFAWFVTSTSQATTPCGIPPGGVSFAVFCLQVSFA